VLFRLLDEAGFSGQRWREVFEDIQVLEVEALRVMSERRNG